MYESHVASCPASIESCGLLMLQSAGKGSLQVLSSSSFSCPCDVSGQICQQWLRQCFWNYLDWQDISHYIALCIVLGADYQVYMCVAVLRFLQQRILLNTQKHELQEFLKVCTRSPY